MFRVQRRGVLKQALVMAVVMVLGRRFWPSTESLGQIPDGSLAWAGDRGAGAPSDAYRAEGCLSVEERAWLEALTDVIIPSDAAGPGAKQAGVARHLEAVVITQPDVRQRYVDGLRGLNTLALRRHGRDFATLPFEKQTELFAYVVAAKQVLWDALSAEGVLERGKRKLAHVYYRRVVGMTDAPMVLVDQVLRDVPEVFYATRAAWEWLGYSGPPFPNGYVGRQSVCHPASGRG